VRILTLCGLQDFAHGLFYDAERVLYGIGPLAASACSGRHESIIGMSRMFFAKRKTENGGT
jgi:hypothetical protein